MAEKKEHQKQFDTCLEDLPCAEMMHKMLGRKGVGSLCADMMQKMREQQGKGGTSACAEMLRSMMKEFGGTKRESTQTQEEESHVGDK